MTTSTLLQAGGILDPASILTGSGPWVIVAIMGIIFIETGLLFPFLPGDSLVFTAALLALPLGIPVPVLVLVVAIAAIAGDGVGYLIGRRYGRRRFTPNARILKTRYLDQADTFLAKYGGRSLVLARFVPIVRTYIPPVVGMSTMHYRTFLKWNAIGGVAWALILTLAGFWLGQIPFVADNIDIISILIVIVSIVPIAVDLLRRRSTRVHGQ
ncbi:VTT domain-containing protein [Cryobacterium sp. GrIS_2_6]|uniref:VTT domain-containing protein n=1 Tax=Cryobacterium sp. GrIS_2_6 TaxID=3162785 RepID=UPI002DFD5B30|nr:membrane-associated protein [Cryobacterium psychrotolerans]